MDSDNFEKITRWLETLELPQYADLFEENDINPDQLSSLDHNLLKELGISSIGHRIKILDSIQSDKGQPTTAIDSGYRTLSVVFIDLAESTALSESLDPESFRQLILEYQEICGNAIKQQGGFIARYFGDGILAYFGYPVADEEDTANSARAALIALEEFSEYSAKTAIRDLPEVSARIGIATGQTLVGDIVGEGAAQEATALGRTPNLAARVQSCASRGEVMLCEQTATLLQGRFDIESCGERKLKGIETQQMLYRLVAENQHADRFAHRVSIGLQPLIGRDVELNLLLKSISTDSKVTTVTQVTGDAGIGKSRLLHELQLNLQKQNQVFLSGHCSPDSTSTPYHPFVNIIKRFCESSRAPTEISAPNDITLRKALSPLLSNNSQEIDYLLQLLGQNQKQLGHIPPELSGRATENALLAFLDSAANKLSRIVIIEDIHWIDSASVRLIKRYNTDKTRPYLRWIFTQRPGTDPDLPATLSSEKLKVELNRLDASHIRSLVTKNLGDSTETQERIDEIVDKCEGNPLFAEEISRHIGKTNVEGEIPSTIDSMFQQRFDALEPELQQCMRNASVLGRQFSIDTLELMPQGEGNARDAIFALKEFNLIIDEPDTGYLAFKHALIRDAVYNSMLREVRSSLHLSAAKAIESVFADKPLSVVETLTEHYQYTNDTDKQVEYLIKSGERALSLYSLDAAETRFEQALSTLENQSSVDNLIQRAEVALKLCRVFYFQYNFKKIVVRAQPYLGLLSADLHPVLYSRLLSECGYANVFRGAANQGETQLSEALQLAESQHNVETIGYASLGLSWYYAHWFTAATTQVNARFERSFNTALNCGRDSSDLWLESKAWMSAGCFHLSRGLFEKAIECSEQLYQLSRENDDPRPRGMGLYVHSMIMSFQEEYERAQELAERALETSISPLDRVTGEAAAIYARLMAGEHERSLREYRELLQRVESAEFRVISFYNIDAPYGLALILNGSMKAGEQHIWNTMRRYQSFGLVLATATAHYYVGKFYSIVALSEERPSPSVMAKNALYLIRIVPRIFSLAIRELESARVHFNQHGNRGFAADSA